MFYVVLNISLSFIKYLTSSNLLHNSLLLMMMMMGVVGVVVKVMRKDPIN